MNPTPDAPSRLRSKLIDLFGIDPRTLAFSRIVVAAVLLYNLATRAVELRAMYSDEGMFPIADVARFWGPDTWRWSLHMLNGSTTYQAMLFAVAAFFALLLLIGLLTRVATIASWVLLASLHTRDPVLVTGGDILLLMLLFWGVFLPWGRRGSVDAWLRGRGDDGKGVLSVASAAILLQVAFMYLFTAFSKCNYLWFGGDALESVFRNPMFTRPLGAWLVQFPLLLKGMTHLTLVLELVGPLLMFCPWKTRVVRAWVVSGFMLLHIGIELTMYVVIFSHASLAALTLFTPSTFWSSTFVRRVAKWLLRSESSPAKTPAKVTTSRLARSAQAVGSMVCIVVLLHVLIVNPLDYFGGPKVYAKIPKAVKRLDELLSLGQQWSMFACPATHNYRYVAVANLRDGTQVEVLRNQPFVGDERPEELSLEPPTQRWVQIMVDLSRDRRSIFRESFTRFLAREWNAAHPLDEQIEHIQLAFMYEKPDWTGFGEDIERFVLAQYDPFASGSYRHGKREGRWVYYYPNGQKEATGAYRNGQEHGLWTFWYEDGRKQGTGTYVDGRMDGKWAFWYEGSEKVEAHFQQGQIVPAPLPAPEQ